MEVSDRIPERALAIYAHPNDADLACGGTLANWSSNGCDVGLVIVTCGDKGGAIGVNGDLSAHRAEEASAAADALKVELTEMLEYPDGEFENDDTLRRLLTGVIRAFEPELVLTHDPWVSVFGDV